MELPTRMSARRAVVALLLCAFIHSACATHSRSPALPGRGAACRIDGPRHLAPASLASIRQNMSKREVDSMMGAPRFSPTFGQYYYATPGECPLEMDGGVHMVPCGLVVAYHTAEGDAAREPSEIRLDARLKDCWWGAIGE